jgi:hypothetical protein
MPGREKAGDVLQEDETGSQLANDASEVGPEPAVILRRFAAPRERVRLAREASADEVDTGEIVSPGESHIVNSASCMGPVSRED